MIPIEGRISQLARDIEMPQGEPLRAGRAIYDYLVDTMVYNYKAPGAGVGDAVLACDSKTGDCTDYHSVFIGVCRWRGIPADHVFGLPIPPEKSEGDIRYAHCWARFWVDGVGWIPIDASRADKFPKDREYYFGTLGTTWVTLSHGWCSSRPSRASRRTCSTPPWPRSTASRFTRSNGSGTTKIDSKRPPSNFDSAGQAVDTIETNSVLGSGPANFVPPR